MNMYVGNASIQRIEFSYRLIGDGKMRTVSIPAMSQALLPDKNLDRFQVDNIVSQHEPYGFASVEEVRSGSVKKRFTRICYSVDKEIASVIIQALFGNNQSLKSTEGVELRKSMAIVANDAVIRQLENSKMQGNAPPEAEVDNFEITIQEEEPATGYDRPKAEIIAEGIKVEGRKTRKRR